jgi:hypothetical protein
VVLDAEQARVVGYHALTAAGIEREAATARIIKGMPQYPIPVVLLARLAVDLSVSGRGLGAWLLRDAMTRTLAAAETIGVRAMLVHAIDQDAARFYLRHGLEASPTEPRHLMILIKDIRPRCGSGASPMPEARRPLLLVRSTRDPCLAAARAAPTKAAVTLDLRLLAVGCARSGGVPRHEAACG